MASIAADPWRMAVARTRMIPTATAIGENDEKRKSTERRKNEKNCLRDGIMMIKRIVA